MCHFGISAAISRLFDASVLFAIGNIADDMPLLMAHVGGPSGPGIALSSDVAHYLNPLVQIHHAQNKAHPHGDTATALT